MKVNFVVRRTKKKVDGTVPIEMTICVKGKRRYVSTGREVKPSDFNSKTQTVKSDKELNEFLFPFRCTLSDVWAKEQKKRTIRFLIWKINAIFAAEFNKKTV